MCEELVDDDGVVELNLYQVDGCGVEYRVRRPSARYATVQANALGNKMTIKRFAHPWWGLPTA